jgi:hypothetical protein
MIAKKNTRWAREEYQRSRYEENKLHRRKKRGAWKGLMEEIEEADRKRRPGSFIGK